MVQIKYLLHSFIFFSNSRVILAFFTFMLNDLLSNPLENLSPGFAYKKDFNKTMLCFRKARLMKLYI